MVASPRLSEIDALRGEYALIAQCGEGQFSRVWKARRLTDNATVAVKVLSCNPGHSRPTHEMSRLSALRHPRLITIYKTGCLKGVAYVEMEYFEGRPMAEIISDFPRLHQYGISQAMRWTAGALEGLDYLHSCGIVHGDVAPGNILINTVNDEVKLVDFDAGTDLRSGGAGDGRPVGTWAYQAPETMGPNVVGYAGDIYSVGCVLYLLVTGSTPYRTIPDLVLRGPFPTAREVNGNVSRRLDAVITRALEAHPEDRYSSARAMLGDLEKCAPASRPDLEAEGRQNPRKCLHVRRFHELWDSLGHPFRDMVEQDKALSHRRGGRQVHPVLVGHGEGRSGLTNDSRCSGRLARLFQLGDVAYRAGYRHTATACYAEIVSEIDRNGGKPEPVLRHALLRLDRLCAAARHLPA